MRRRPTLAIETLEALPHHRAALDLLRGSTAAFPGVLAIGAGHRTHLSLLALRRSHRCPVIVLMRPTLPLGCFDLCVEPRHDGGSESARRWLSDGPINRMHVGSKTTSAGLILLGGPSDHYDWDETRLLEQIEYICGESGPWQVSPSRRTPVGFLAALRNRQIPDLDILDIDKLPANWLARQLPTVDKCWVTPDSASMVYEALSAGCAVGLLELQSRASSRVARGVATLVERRLVTPHTAFRDGAKLTAPAAAFAEADRIAARIEGLGWLPS